MPMDWNRPELAKCAANYVPLTPVSFLKRAARIFAGRTAVIDRERSFTYAEFDGRCRRFASALTKAGIGRGDTVAILASNVTAMLEAHFAVPMIGAVLNPINIRLDAATIASTLDHGEARLLLADREFHGTIAPALELAATKPIVIDIADPETGDMPKFGNIEYEDFIASGDPGFEGAGPEDETRIPHRRIPIGRNGPEGPLVSPRRTACRDRRHEPRILRDDPDGHGPLRRDLRPAWPCRPGVRPSGTRHE